MASLMYKLQNEITTGREAEKRERTRFCINSLYVNGCVLVSYVVYSKRVFISDRLEVLESDFILELKMCVHVGVY